MRTFDIRPAAGAADMDAARELIREYLGFLGENLAYQDVEAELADLPGTYSPPGGCLLLARTAHPMAAQPAAADNSAGNAAGCVALRALEAGVCEMKRLFVRTEFRGTGLGRTLTERAMREARALGYRRMRLDTLERLDGAVRLYRSLGFRTIDPYCPNPLPGAMFWEKEL